MARTRNKTTKKNKGGQPSPYNPSIHPAIAKQSCRHNGDTHKELAKALEISTATLSIWKRDHYEFLEAVMHGTMEYDCGPITNALRECCLGSEYDEVKRDFVEVAINGKLIHCTERKVMVDLLGNIVSGLLESDRIIGEIPGKQNPYIYNNNNTLNLRGKKGKGKTKKNSKDEVANPNPPKDATKADLKETKQPTPKLTSATVLVEGEKVTITHKKRLPESTAIFFWLQNRKSKLWKNVQRQIVENTTTANHKHEHVHKMVKIDKEENERYRKLIHDAGSRDREVDSNPGGAGHGSSLPESQGVHDSALAPSRN